MDSPHTAPSRCVCFSSLTGRYSLGGLSRPSGPPCEGASARHVPGAPRFGKCHRPEPHVAPPPQNPRGRRTTHSPKPPKRVSSHAGTLRPRRPAPLRFDENGAALRRGHCPPVNGPCHAPPPRVTFRRGAAALRGPGQSPVLPFACCVGSLRFVGRCGRCSRWCRFRVRRAPSRWSHSPKGQHAPPPPSPSRTHGRSQGKRR